MYTAFWRHRATRGEDENHYPCFSPILIWSTPKYAKEERRQSCRSSSTNCFWRTEGCIEVIGYWYCGKINTAYIERFNLTIRNSLARFIRRGMNCSKDLKMHSEAIDFFQAWYNFVKPHHSLRLEVNSGRKKWIQRTPAMAEGITDHVWVWKSYWNLECQFNEGHTRPKNVIICQNASSDSWPSSIMKPCGSPW